MRSTSKKVELNPVVKRRCTGCGHERSELEWKAFKFGPICPRCYPRAQPGYIAIRADGTIDKNA